MPGGDVDKAQLTRYIELEKEVQRLEGRNVLKKFDEIKNNLKEIEQEISRNEATLAQQKQQTRKELADVERMKEQSIKDMIVDQANYNKQLSREQVHDEEFENHSVLCQINIELIIVEKEKRDVKNMLCGSIKEMFESNMAEYQKQLTKEQEEYLEAKSKEESTQLTIDGLNKQKCELDEKTKELGPDAEKLKAMYLERDTLLSDIFNGEYGSEEENRLEAQFDVLMEKKQRISVAYTKWSSAKVLLMYGVSQLKTVVDKWDHVGKTDPRNMQLKYSLTTEARNNLVAASQNIRSMQRYLVSITFPYCQPQEIDVLDRAMNNIYTDMQTPDRHQHANQCYTVTWKRANALLQWFDNVIQQTIQMDLKKATQEAKTVEQQLRAERIKLIRAKVEESGESTKDLNIGGLKGEAGGDLDEEELDLKAVGICHPDGVSEDPKLPDMQKLSVNQQQEEDMRPPPTPIPLCDLAPAPNTEDLFGNIDDLKKQHQKHTEDFSKAQQMNKTRMEQGLQAKLQQRRHKKRDF